MHVGEWCANNSPVDVVIYTVFIKQLPREGSCG